MNLTTKEFVKQKEKNILFLQKIKDFLLEGKNLGVNIDESLFAKIQNAINNTQNDKLKVALVGGFSEGKTSIAAAWLEKLQEDSMKISARESSDEVNIYEFENIQIVDTPGLFGFKEKENNEKYKDITKRYISEANLIIYVTNSTNPIKESHKEDLIWLFRSLNLLSRTIFVLSRFDEVADVGDEEEYNEALKIKKENVLSRLDEFLNLTLTEKENISIVGISANPFEQGLEYYLKNIQEYKKLSHIQTLQSATQNKIKENGGDLKILEETKKSIVKDVLNKQLPETKKNYILVKQDLEKFNSTHNEINRELKLIEERVKHARIGLREFVIEYFDDLILQLHGTIIETFQEFLIREVGEKGINIEQKILNEFEFQTNSINLELKSIETNYNFEINTLQNSLVTFGKIGINKLIDRKFAFTNTMIIGVRDFLNLNIKFKPWEAVKFAGYANKAIPFINVAFEAWDSWNKHKKEQEFQKAKNNMNENFNKQKNEILSLISSDDFFKNFFPQYIQLQNILSEYEAQRQDIEKKEEALLKWAKQGEIIEAEVLSQRSKNAISE